MSFNIAIDGPSAAGKSTIAKLIAEDYGLKMLDTGSMYRAVALAAKKEGIDIDDEKALTTLLESLNITINSEQEVLLNGQDIQKEIRNDEISMAASKISAYEAVRNYLVALQQKLTADRGFVLEGRDIGTVVLPDADVKIFLVASSETRAERRYQEYKNKGYDVNFKDIKEDIEQRDYQDTHRSHSPLKQAKDAVMLDSSNLSIDEVIIEIRNIIEDKVGVTL